MKKMLVLSALAIAACGTQAQESIAVSQFGNVTASTLLTTVGIQVNTVATTSTSKVDVGETAGQLDTSRQVIDTTLTANDTIIAVMEIERMESRVFMVAHCPYGEKSLEVPVEFAEVNGLGLEDLNRLAVDKFMEVGPELGHDLSALGLQ